MKFSLSIKIETDGPKHYKLGNPISVSRSIQLQKQSQAFNLPKFYSKTVEINEQFIGDVTRGGSCNVDTISFTPHNLTHLETSAHILNQKDSSSLVKDIPRDHLQGILYLVDLSELISNDVNLIHAEILKNDLKSVDLPINALAIKTKSSLLPEHYDFSDNAFIALSEEAAKVIHEFRDSSIKCLLLDLPSTDPEHDEGKLLAHRAFFGLPQKGYDYNDQEKRVICELAYFSNVVQNYYYFIVTPAKIETNAMITDIVLFPLFKID